MTFLRSKKIGFLGAGNMAQAIIKGLLDSKTMDPDKIFVSNRTDTKLKRVEDSFGIKGFKTNEELVDNCNVIVLSTKPQDIYEAIENIAMSFDDDQIIISLAAGISLESLKKVLPDAKNIVRVMPNTPIRVSQAVIGYCLDDDKPIVEDIVESIFEPLGYLVKCEDEEKLAALTVAASSGVGFIFELMQYWQDWIMGYGFSKQVAHSMAIESFFGSAKLAYKTNNNENDFYGLLKQVTSKKGVTAAGLDSMRELDIERALRISFEKAMLRDKELDR